MTDLDDKHYQFAVTHFVYDAVVANADTQPAALASQCLDAGRSGLSAQSLGGALDTTRLSGCQACGAVAALPGGISARSEGRSLVVGDA